MNKEFIQAISDLEKEKQISKEVLIDAIESALVSAYKKNYGTSQNVRVNIDRETGDIDVFMRMDIVDEVEDDLVQISLEEAREKIEQIIQNMEAGHLPLEESITQFEKAAELVKYCQAKLDGYRKKIETITMEADDQHE